jgi:hypothetical protein
MRTMRFTAPRSGVQTGLGWLVMGFVAWLVGIYLFFGIGWSLSNILLPQLGRQLSEYMSFTVGGVVFGTLLGVATGLVFANRVGSFRRWVLFSIIGFVIGSPLAYGIAVVRDDIIAAMSGGAVIGLTVGIAQWSVMPRVPHAGWWVVANVVAFAAAFACAFALS